MEEYRIGLASLALLLLACAGNGESQDASSSAPDVSDGARWSGCTVRMAA